MLATKLLLETSSCVVQQLPDGTKSLEKIAKNLQVQQRPVGNIITLLPDKQNHSIDGFSYAITYSSCYNLLKMPKALRSSLLKKTFSQKEGYGASYVTYFLLGVVIFRVKSIRIATRREVKVDPISNFALYSDETDYDYPSVEGNL